MNFFVQKKIMWPYDFHAADTFLLVPPSAVDMILVVNGLYDILCAFSILWLHRLPGFHLLSNIHVAMFKDERHYSNPVICRLLAYWVLTYGTVRTAAGCHHSHSLDTVGALTYFIEAFCFEYESRVGETMIRSKVAFVSACCLLIGVLVLARPI